MLKTNEENIECTMANVENVKMTEVDENEKIETVDLDVDRGDCEGHGWGASSIHNIKGGEIKTSLLEICF